MAADPKEVICEHCASTDVEVVIETRNGWGCFCRCCGKTFGLRKPLAVRLEDEAERRGDASA